MSSITQIAIPSLVRVKPGAIDRLGVYLSRSEHTQAILMVSQGLVPDYLGRVRRSLADSGIQCLETVTVADASFESAAEVLTRLPRKVKAIIARRKPSEYSPDARMPNPHRPCLLPRSIRGVHQYPTTLPVRWHFPSVFQDLFLECGQRIRVHTQVQRRLQARAPVRDGLYLSVFRGKPGLQFSTRRE